MQLIKAPSDFLKTKMDAFDFESNDAPKIAEEMINDMIKFNGVGLAANQVGFNGRIFVMKPKSGKPYAVINPTIEGVSATSKLDVEGCLSFPNLFLYVNRPDKVDVNFLDIEGKNVTMLLEDLEARIFLHEFDHLEGITFDTRVSKFKLQMAKERQRKLENK
jgi:peptide deformylase|tara:strand:- start:1963 stop:2448 length:486 start_codon:yes stop_codon:yes gene_type:complete